MKISLSSSVYMHSLSLPLFAPFSASWSGSKRERNQGGEIGMSKFYCQQCRHEELELEEAGLKRERSGLELKSKLTFFPTNFGINLSGPLSLPATELKK